MSAHNFWDNFSHGFMHGMFNNSPFLGCSWGGWGCNTFFNSCFTPMFNFNYMVPNVFAGMNFNSLMPDMSVPPLPNISININELFPTDNWMESAFNNSNFNFNPNTSNVFNNFTNNTSTIFPTDNWLKSINNSYNFTFDTFENTTSRTSTAQNRNYSDQDTSNHSYDADALKNKWQKKKPNLTQGFYNKVVQIAKRINCSPDDLMALMNSESGINPSVKNKKSGATGLIQFMPSTAEGLGTSTTALAQMSAEEQLSYVEKCIMSSKRSAGLGNSKVGPGTLYALIFLPARANREQLTRKGENYYDWNPNLDLDKDDIISKADLAKRIDECRA